MQINDANNLLFYLALLLSCSSSNSTALYDNRRGINSIIARKKNIGSCYGWSLSTSSLFLRGGGSSSASIELLENPTSSTNGGSIVPKFIPMSLIGILRSVLSISLGVTAGVAAYKFSLYFPFLLTPEAAKATYIPASYSYNQEESLFCNSAWSYATDYGLVAVMLYLANKIIANNSSNNDDLWREESIKTRSITTTRLAHRACALMLVYATQFSGGGIAHQFFTTVESRNTKGFRLLWTIVVGAVCASGGVIGALASELAWLGIISQDDANNQSKKALLGRLVPSDLFWIGYGGLLVAMCISGHMSHQRPAADTFVAGVSQAPPTFFLMAIVALIGTANSWRNDAASTVALTMKDILKCNLGFVMNSCLLPTYALSLYRTNIPVAYLNASFHTWLCGCYSLQGLSLNQIVQAFSISK